MYARLLTSEVGDNDTVVFTAGGSATGKTSILRAAGKTPGVSFIVDTTFSNVVRAMREGFQKAIKKANKDGVTLQEIIPVS